MNNEILGRLERLMKSLNLTTEKGSYTEAEMKAYAAGLSLAAEALESTFNNLFVDSASGLGIAMFLSMVGEKPAKTEEESRQMIIDTASLPREIYSKSEFDKDISMLFGMKYTVLGNNLVFKFNIVFSRITLELLSKLTVDIVPCTSIVCAGGSGQKFGAWGNLDFHWYELDSYELSFYALDTL